MKKLLVLILFPFFTITIKADYEPIDLYIMIFNADKIVYGEISSVDSTTFTLKINGSLTGQEGEIRVSKFKNWTSAHRWMDYNVGQKLFLFLSNYQGRLITMSAGNEGELPIFQDSVYINSLSLVPPPPPGLENKEPDFENIEFFCSKKHKLYGTYYHGYSVNLQEFILSVKNIRDCFDIETGEYNSIAHAHINCSKAKVDELLAIDKIFRWTYHEIIE